MVRSLAAGRWVRGHRPAGKERERPLCLRFEREVVYFVVVDVGGKKKQQRLKNKRANKVAADEGTGSSNERVGVIRSPACTNGLPGYVADRHSPSPNSDRVLSVIRTREEDGRDEGDPAVSSVRPAIHYGQ